MSARVSYQGYILCFCAVIVAVLLHDADLMTSFEAKLEDDALRHPSHATSRFF